MNPDTPLFGRITINSKRISLGRAPVTSLMIRAVEQMRKVRHREDMLIQIELSPSRLMESSTFDRLSVMEQQLAERVITDGDTDSPFEGIKVGRVAEAMESPEYEAYAEICDPVKRQGLSDDQIRLIRDAYEAKFPDCACHFPFWIE